MTICPLVKQGRAGPGACAVKRGAPMGGVGYGHAGRMEIQII